MKQDNPGRHRSQSTPGREKVTNMPVGRTKAAALAASTSVGQETLDSLKKALAIEGGIIKNTVEARNHLDFCGLITLDAEVTYESTAKILLLLVVSSTTKRTLGDKIPESVANIIKATAFLLEIIAKDTQTMETRIADTIAAKIIASNTQPTEATQDLKIQLETNVNFLKQAANSQAQVTHNTNALVEKLEKLCTQAKKTFNNTLSTAKETIASTTLYKDALTNGHAQNHPTLQTPTQMKILNRINIKECQLMVEYETNTLDKLVEKNQTNDRPPSLQLKDAINNWLNAPDDQDRTIPPKAAARVITLYGNSKMMIEMNSREAADWMQSYPDRILGGLLKCLITVITHTYPVVARFILINFDITHTSLQTVENDLGLPNSSIRKAKCYILRFAMCSSSKYIRLICLEWANSLYLLIQISANMVLSWICWGYSQYSLKG